MYFSADAGVPRRVKKNNLTPLRVNSFGQRWRMSGPTVGEKIFAQFYRIASETPPATTNFLI
jgi:hypothetical protein